MSKRKKKQSSPSTRHTPEKILPRAYFRQIGVVPFIDPNDQLLYRVVRKKVGKELADKYYESQCIRKDHRSVMYLSFSHLELAKLWYGNQLDQACKIAEELATIPVPAHARVLDIGGGPGVLAFWMTHLWGDCHVTVADNCPEVGAKWAIEIENDRVAFVESLLPDLKNIPDHAYDVVVMSRVLRYIDELHMPKFIKTHNLTEYLGTQEGIQFSLRFGELIDKIKRVLAPDGHLVIVDEWNDLNVFVTCKAMEQNGLFIDEGFFKFERLSKEFSVIAFSASERLPDLSIDFSMGLSASLNFPQIPLPFTGTLAESLRKLFGGTKPILEFESEPGEDNIKWKNEILEKYGIAMVYGTNGYGARMALMYPAAAIPKLLIANEKVVDNDIPSVSQSDSPSSR